MAHLHSVYDNDTHFKIDPATRQIANESGKVILMQNDHNSERFTFEIPRYIDGHDMSVCNKVEVHFINLKADKTEKHADVYPVEDLQISPASEDVVICSWLISQNATKYAGSLNFVLRYACLTGSVIDYQWYTDIHKGISVSESISNTESVAIEYSDILEAWREELMESGGVSDEQIAQAVEDYMAEHPIEVPDSGGNANQGGGLSTKAANLLITILQNVTLYDTNQLENISALQTELLSGAGSGGGDNPDTVMYTVSNNLSRVSNSNPLTSVEENSAYSAVLTALEGYTLEGGIVTVTMGGKDITETAYAGGVVEIGAVTGNVVISATAVLDGVIYTLPGPVSNETGTADISYIVDTGIGISNPAESKTITFSFTPNEDCAASVSNFNTMLCSSGNGVVGAANSVSCTATFDGKNVQFRIRDGGGSNTTTDLLTGGALGDTWKCVWMYDASAKTYTYKAISVNTAGVATNVVEKTVDISTWELEEKSGTMIVGGWKKDNAAYAMTNTTVHDMTIYNGLLDDDAVTEYLVA